MTVIYIRSERDYFCFVFVSFLFTEDILEINRQKDGGSIRKKERECVLRRRLLRDIKVIDYLLYKYLRLQVPGLFALGGVKSNMFGARVTLQ